MPPNTPAPPAIPSSLPLNLGSAGSIATATRPSGLTKMKDRTDYGPVYDAILRHSSAHLRQARTQSLQCWCSCLAHSMAHASQTWAHTAQSFVANSLPRDISRAASAQRSAQSRSSSMQRAIFCTSVSWRHSDAQCSQAAAQALQASIQSWYS